MLTRKPPPGTLSVSPEFSHCTRQSQKQQALPWCPGCSVVTALCSPWQQCHLLSALASLLPPFSVPTQAACVADFLLPLLAWLYPKVLEQAKGTFLPSRYTMPLSFTRSLKALFTIETSSIHFWCFGARGDSPPAPVSSPHISMVPWGSAPHGASSAVGLHRGFPQVLLLSQGWMIWSDTGAWGEGPALQESP